MEEKISSIAAMREMKTFSARDIKIQFFSAIGLNAIALAALICYLVFFR